MRSVIHIPEGQQCTQSMVLTIKEPETELVIEMENNTSLNLICIELAPSDAEIVITQKSTLGTNAKLSICNITLGGKSVTHDLVSSVRGEGSESSIDWLFYGKDAEKQNLSAKNIFDAPNGRGEIAMYGVAQNHAKTSINGCIEITKNGAGTQTYLTEKTLMLDSTAKVHVVPGLEIKTNDVKASHSATVSKVTDEELFYFASRGIEEAIARKMYLEGFLGALVQKFPEENVRELVLGEIAKKYNRA